MYCLTKHNTTKQGNCYLNSKVSVTKNNSLDIHTSPLFNSFKSKSSFKSSPDSSTNINIWPHSLQVTTHQGQLTESKVPQACCGQIHLFAKTSMEYITRIIIIAPNPSNPHHRSPESQNKTRISSPCINS